MINLRVITSVADSGVFIKVIIGKHRSIFKTFDLDILKSREKVFSKALGWNANIFGNKLRSCRETELCFVHSGNLKQLFFKKR
jgi:hypothetical protein